METLAIKVEITDSDFITAKEAKMLSLSRTSDVVVEMMKDADRLIRAAARKGEACANVYRNTTYGKAAWEVVKAWLVDLGFIITNDYTNQCTVWWEYQA